MASISCHLVVVVVCARRLRMNLAIVAVIGLAGLTFEPFLRTILLGKINLVLLALVVVDCPVVPERYQGMLIGFATGIKILPSAFILFLLLNGSGRRLAAPPLSSPAQSAWAPCSHHTTPVLVLERWIHQPVPLRPGGDHRGRQPVFERCVHEAFPRHFAVVDSRGS